MRTDNEAEDNAEIPFHLPGVNVEEFARLTKAEKVALSANEAS